ncbi:MAG: hypothetical protein L0Y66_10575 [Myxococcaceae bacterium]|nr:hypothetical protein [Myxococcaceae bacterium]MCI0672226.1 hypothetical protein [Myxococcaceae bacterium]
MTTFGGAEANPSRRRWWAWMWGCGVVAYVLLANSVVGVVCGALYRARGLESAMLAHGTADVWLHVVLPLAVSVVGSA